jgi:hypothetical protein
MLASCSRIKGAIVELSLQCPITAEPGTIHETHANPGPTTTTYFIAE